MPDSRTLLAVQNAEVLLRLGRGPRPDNIKAFARELGRDDSNLGKSLRLLEREGLADAAAFSLTAAGRELLPRLSVLAGEAPAAEDASDIVLLQRDQLAPHPENPRTDFDSDGAQEDLDALRQSIVLTRRIRQNLEVLRPDANGVHLIVAGERRFRAACAAIDEDDLPSDFRFPCRVIEVEDDADRLGLALDENLQRRDLHPVEEGRAYRRLVREHGRSTAEIADRHGRSQKHVQDRIALVERLSEADLARMFLPADDPNHLSYTAARALMQVHKPAPEMPPVPEPTPPVNAALSDEPPPADRAPRLPTGGSFGAAAAAPAPAGAQLAAKLSREDKRVLLEVAHAANHGPRGKSKMHAVHELGYVRVVQAPGQGHLLDAPTRRLLGLYNGLGDKPPVCLGIEDSVFRPGVAGVWLLAEGRAVVAATAPALLNIDKTQAEADAVLRGALTALGFETPAKGYCTDWLNFEPPQPEAETKSPPELVADAWTAIDTAPRDGTHILLAFGQDHVSQGWWEDNDDDPRPWKFIDTGCPGSSFRNGELLNGCRDGSHGPSHWRSLPSGPFSQGNA